MVVRRADGGKNHDLHDNANISNSVQVYTVGNFFSYQVVTLSLFDSTPSPTSVQASTWGLALVFDVIRLVTFLIVNKDIQPMSRWDAIEVLINVLRLSLLIGLIFFYLLFTKFNKKRKPQASPEEDTHTKNE